jgi:Ran GTPase-activating protein (RanGAP) involved in mRNA processing and transport
MAILKEQLADSIGLKTLIFNNNMVGPEGAAHFADIVATCPALTNINYAQVCAGLAGTHAVLQAIVDNKDLNLVSLDINSAKLYSEGNQGCIDHFGQAITQNPTLTHLHIGDCELTNVGMNQLLPTLLQAGLSPGFSTCPRMNSLSSVVTVSPIYLSCSDLPFAH